jgi:hypothetical protein
VSDGAELDELEHIGETFFRETRMTFTMELRSATNPFNASLYVQNHLFALGADGNQFLDPSLPAFCCIVARAEHG